MKSPFHTAFINKTPGIPLVAHNGQTFDIPVIRECCNYYGMEIPSLTYFDSLLVARKTWPQAQSHKLTELAKDFEINYLAHDALEDSRTCGQIINLAAKKWGVNSVNELLTQCELNIHNL